MSMFLLSEKLLQKELKEKPIILNDQQDFYYSLVEKELYLIQRLNIEMCDMRGKEQEVANRLSHSQVLICSPEEVNDMQKSVLFKDEIMDIIKKYDMR